MDEVHTQGEQSQIVSLRSDPDPAAFHLVRPGQLAHKISDHCGEMNA
jgi:hypothetical protein